MRGFHIFFFSFGAGKSNNFSNWLYYDHTHNPVWDPVWSRMRIQNNAKPFWRWHSETSAFDWAVIWFIKENAKHQHAWDMVKNRMEKNTPRIEVLDWFDTLSTKSQFGIVTLVKWHVRKWNWQLDLLYVKMQSVHQRMFFNSSAAF